MEDEFVGGVFLRRVLDGEGGLHDDGLGVVVEVMDGREEEGEGGGEKDEREDDGRERGFASTGGAEKAEGGDCGTKEDEEEYRE